MNKRQVKSHRKSRNGCGECKLRRVKCDEDKPICKRCRLNDSACLYGANNALFELTVNKVIDRRVTDCLAFSLSLDVPKPGRHALRPQDVRLLSAFRSDTALTVTTNRNRSLYQDQIVEMAPQVC